MTRSDTTKRAHRSLKAFLKGPPRRSQRWLAQRVGCNQSTISLLARGMRGTRLKTLQRISQVTGIPVTTLLNTLVRSDYVRPPEPRRMHDHTDDDDHGTADDLADRSLALEARDQPLSTRSLSRLPLRPDRLRDHRAT